LIFNGLELVERPFCGELVESAERPINFSFRIRFVGYLYFLNYYMTAWFYILRLQSGNLYIGSTKDLKKRYRRHRDGSGGTTTSTDPPVSLVYSEVHESFSKARKREAQIKRWSRAKKEALVAGDKDKLRALSKPHKN
jgi:putative endonuclease